MIVGGLDSEPRTDGAARFRILVTLMIFRYRSDRGWSQRQLTCLKRSGGCMQDRLLQPLDCYSEGLYLLQQLSILQHGNP